MALFCLEGKPINYDDNNEDAVQNIDSTKQKCFLITYEGISYISLKDDENIKGIRVRPGYNLKIYSKDNNLITTYPATNEGISIYYDFIDNKKIENIELSYSGIIYDDTNPETGSDVELDITPLKCQVKVDDQIKDITDFNVMQIEGGCKDIVKQKCEKESNLFNSIPCRTHCSKLPDNCKKSFKNFCSNIKNQKDCIYYCNIEQNKDACLQYISEYCTGNKILTDKFCQSTAIIASSKDNDNYEKVMKTYCNSNGKQKDLTKIDNLDKPICACYDKALIEKKFSNIKIPYIKTAITLKPECYYDKCRDNPQAYKKIYPEDYCDLSLCKDDLDENPNPLIFLVSEKDKNDKDCIKEPPGTNTGTGTTTGTTGSGTTTGTTSGTTSGTTTESGTTTGTTTESNSVQYNNLINQLLNNKFNFNNLNIINKIFLFVLLFVLLFMLLKLFIFFKKKMQKHMQNQQNMQYIRNRQNMHNIPNQLNQQNMQNMQNMRNQQNIHNIPNQLNQQNIHNIPNQLNQQNIHNIPNQLNQQNIPNQQNIHNIPNQLNQHNIPNQQYIQYIPNQLN